MLGDDADHHVSTENKPNQTEGAIYEVPIFPRLRRRRVRMLICRAAHTGSRSRLGCSAHPRMVQAAEEVQVHQVPATYRSQATGE
jgi:hypothetical protein